MANTANTSEWDVSTDIYSVVKSVDNLKRRFIEDENETTLALGIFGFMGDTAAKKIQSAIVETGELGNEMFPTRAKLTKNVLTHATYSDIENINATPSHITLNVGIRLDDIEKYIEDDRFILDAEAPIFVGETEFHFDYDVIITRIKTKSTTRQDEYSYTAQYKMLDDDGNIINNRLSNVTNQYLMQPFVVKLSNYNYLIFQATLHQYSIETTRDKMVTDSIIANKTYTFEFANQIADFDVYLTDNGKTYKLQPFPYGSDSQNAVYFCWYLYISDNVIRITFDRNSIRPGLNSDIRIVAYTCLGNAGNFEYIKVDNTSEGFYFNSKSARYNYSKIDMFYVAVTDSTDGQDRKSKTDLQKLIPKAALARGSVTSEKDLNNYFNLIENEDNRLVMQKKVDNQLSRVWFGYFLMKNQVGNVIPTNTIDIHINLDSSYWTKSPDGRIIVPAGTGVYLKSNGEYGELMDIGDVPSPFDNEKFFGNSYYYATMYSIVLCRDPLYSAFYVISVNNDSFFTFKWVNMETYTQFVANRLNYQRNLLTDQNRYRISFSIAQSLAEDFGLYSVEEEEVTVTNDEGDETVEISSTVTVNIKCVLVLYKEKVAYRWKECTFDEDNFDPDGEYIYSFYVDLFTDNGLDTKNCIKLNDLNVAGSAQDTNYGYFDPVTEARLYVLARFDSSEHESRERGEGDDCLDNVTKDKYKDYVVTNIYNIDQGLSLYENFTDVIDAKVTALDEEGMNFIVSGVPVVGCQYIHVDIDEVEDNADYLLDAIMEKKSYIDYCLGIVENNMNIDFKFFNTYGPSRTYYTEEEDPINHVDLIMYFKLSLKSTSDLTTKGDIIDRIKEYMEDLYDTGDFHAPNLITDITNEFNDRINYLEFVGFNTFGADIQHIIEADVEDPYTVPEFLNIRNVYDENSRSLVPCIDIEIV